MLAATSEVERLVAEGVSPLEACARPAYKNPLDTPEVRAKRAMSQAARRTASLGIKERRKRKELLGAFPMPGNMTNVSRFPYGKAERFFVGRTVEFNGWFFHVTGGSPQGELTLKALGKRVTSAGKEDRAKTGPMRFNEAKDFLCPRCVACGVEFPKAPVRGGLCEDHAL